MSNVMKEKLIIGLIIAVCFSIGVWISKQIEWGAENETELNTPVTHDYSFDVCGDKLFIYDDVHKRFVGIVSYEHTALDSLILNDNK